MIRSCGYERFHEHDNSTDPEVRNCYKTKHPKHYQTYVCQCFDDGCNEAAGLQHLSLMHTLFALILLNILG